MTLRFESAHHYTNGKFLSLIFWQFGLNKLKTFANFLRTQRNQVVISAFQIRKIYFKDNIYFRILFLNSMLTVF